MYLSHDTKKIFALIADVLLSGDLVQEYDNLVLLNLIHQLKKIVTSKVENNDYCRNSI